MTKRTSREAIEDAWRIHDAQMDWTTRVDAKASFAFGIESVIVAAVATLSVSTTAFSSTGWFQLGYWIGMGLLSAAAVLSALVVAPVLRSSNLESESKRDHIYFGHIRHLSATQLEERLKHADLLPVLTRQIRRMAGLNWTKHRRVQASISLGVIGAGLVTISVLVPTWSPDMRRIRTLGDHPAQELV